MTSGYTKTEQEVIILNAIWKMIDVMVNFEIFCKLRSTQDIHLQFKNPTEQRLFNIHLLDILSYSDGWSFDLPKPREGGMKSGRSALFLLEHVIANPILNPAGKNILFSPLNDFIQWLEADCLVKGVWLQSINIEADIKLKRIDYINICGNIAKHNYIRLGRVVKEIRKVYKDNGINLTKEEGYLIIPEFFEWFHSHVLSYHSSAIAEFLNNIRLGIFEYLEPEFNRSYTEGDENSPGYSFKNHSECDSPFVQFIFVDLMNLVRAKPIMPRFEVTKYLKERY